MFIIVLSIHKYTSATTDQQLVQLSIVNNHNVPPDFDIVIMLVNQRWRPSGLYTPNSRIRPSESLA